MSTSPRKTQRPALGMGLDALLPDRLEGEYFLCPVEDIRPSPQQPRQHFDPLAIDELAQSIREKGLIQPVILRRTGAEGYELIAGERRWRAAQKAGVQRVPVVVREISPIESLELALIENIHRKDLNPIEEALAYNRWLDDSQMTQETLAKKLGKDRTTITNMLRLLKLPQIIQKDLIDNRLSMGHARVLAGLTNQEAQKAIRDEIIKKGLSVRQVEDLVRKRERSQHRKKGNAEEDHYMRSLAENLKRTLGTKVDLRKRGKQGSIVIYFYSEEELDRLLEILT